MMDDSIHILLIEDDPANRCLTFRQQLREGHGGRCDRVSSKEPAVPGRAEPSEAPRRLTYSLSLPLMLGLILY